MDVLAVVSAADTLGGLASGNTKGLQGISESVRSASEALGAYLPWPLADPEVQLGADLANIVALQPQWPGVLRLLVSPYLLFKNAEVTARSAHCVALLNRILEHCSTCIFSGAHAAVEGSEA